MPRSGGIYSKPSGTTAVFGQTIQSSKFNELVDDIVTDLNTARPISAGGTGATTAATARTALGSTATGDALFTAASAAAARTTLGTGVAGLEFLASLDASSSATMDFTAFDATRYDAYKFILGNLIPATDGATLNLRLSTDGGSSFISTSTYSTAAAVASPTNAIAGATGSATTAAILSGAIGNGTLEQGLSGEITVYFPHISARTYITYSIYYATTDGTQRFYSGGANSDVNQVHNALRFYMSSGNIASGSITMFGLRNS